jgi:uncharacterized membrane protein YqiK
MFFKKAQPGQALVRVGAGGTVVSFDKLNVYPILHQLITVDLSLRQLSLHLTNERAVLCKDFIKADVKVVFTLKIYPDAPDIRRILNSFDAAQLANPEYLAKCFFSEFEYAIRVVAQFMSFIDLSQKTMDFADRVLEVIGRDLYGFVLDDMVVESIEQTSANFYNDDDYLELQGKAHIGQYPLQKLRKPKNENTQAANEAAYAALLEQQALEVALVNTEVDQQLEIARLKATQEVLAAQQDGSDPALVKSRQDEVALALEKAQAVAETTQQQITQLRPDK